MQANDYIVNAAVVIAHGFILNRVVTFHSEYFLFPNHRFFLFTEREHLLLIALI